MSTQFKRKAQMSELAQKAKELNRAHKHKACTATANEWVKLATVNDMVRAPAYLKWTGRIS